MREGSSLARFRFKIVDSQGRRRSGVLRADSREVAESALQSKLCLIEELTPLPDDGQAVEIHRLESSFQQLDRARHGLMAALASVFLVSLYAWFGRPTPPPAQASPQAEQTVEFQARGELLLDPSQGEPSEWTVYVQFPELPFEVGARLDDEQSGSFVLPVDLLGERPEKADVEVEHEGRRWRAAAAVAVPAQGDLRLGAIAVAEPKPEPEEKLVLSVPVPGQPGEPRNKGRRLNKKTMQRAIDAQRRGL